MRHLLIALLLVPIISNGQSQKNSTEGTYNEIGLNIGYAPDNAEKGPYHTTEWRGGYLRGTLRGLRNKGWLQYGVSIEGGTTSRDYWYFSPTAILNWKLPVRRGYFYAGGVAGYVCTDDMMKDSRGPRMGNGYMTGAQGGYAWRVSTHWFLTAEAGARWMQFWTANDLAATDVPFVYERKTTVHEIWLLPVTIGVNYRL